MIILYDNIEKYTNVEFQYFYTFLSIDDKDRLNKIVKVNDKKLFILSRFLLNKLLDSKYNIDYKKLKIYYNKFNKPLTNNIFFNISHKANYCVVCTSLKKIGVDIEKIKHINLNIINYVCTYYEKEYILNSNDIDKSFFEIFCLKEAYIKMLGSNLSSIKNIEFRKFNEKFICSSNYNIIIELLYNIDGYMVAIVQEK